MCIQPTSIPKVVPKRLFGLQLYCQGIRVPKESTRFSHNILNVNNGSVVYDQAWTADKTEKQGYVQYRNAPAKHRTSFFSLNDCCVCHKTETTFPKSSHFSTHLCYYTAKLLLSRGRQSSVRPSSVKPVSSKPVTQITARFWWKGTFSPYLQIIFFFKIFHLWVFYDFFFRFP